METINYNLTKEEYSNAQYLLYLREIRGNMYLKLIIISAMTLGFGYILLIPFFILESTIGESILKNIFKKKYNSMSWILEYDENNFKYRNQNLNLETSFKELNKKYYSRDNLLVFITKENIRIILPKRIIDEKLLRILNNHFYIVF